MRLTYFGHSAFLLEIPGPPAISSAEGLTKAEGAAKAGQRLLFDPWLRKNPQRAVDPASVPCDYILCSHAHDDHLGDALELSRLHDATIVAPYELAEHLTAQGATTIDLMPGGGITLPWGRIDMTPAVHSSALEFGNGETKSIGVASGYVIRAGGKSLYHAGDTGLFGDMRLIGRHGLDVALIPIGDFYTMGPADAVEALHLLRPRLAIPMHFNTNEKIRVDPDAFAADAARAGHTVRVMSPGEIINL
jgi:L-ascorbate metabolism protein UlaG (beta-lactamase superfamily)